MPEVPSSSSDIVAPPQDQQQDSMFRKIQALLSHLGHQSTGVKTSRSRDKPLLLLLNDVVSALPSTPPGLSLNANKQKGNSVDGIDGSNSSHQPTLVVLSDVKSKNKKRRSSRQDSAVESISGSTSIREGEPPHELKVYYSLESHPHRFCLDVTFVPQSKGNADTTASPAKSSSKSSKRKRRSKAKKRAATDAKAKAEELTIRQDDNGSYTTTTVSATGLGRHTRWHYDS
ncbi:hypothetical protein CVT26_013145 [Gymnopilus dilepis]|uniref:Uncharacterized protein n=1 Tax=Gymnopilus dilepis TaxID=231916 RepID=A0A409WUZ6_9AGAR|nr:hypothetical protein CVT26_013145 [Gymnopilus dilepis]